MQFEHAGRVPGLDTFHLHLRWFAVWELERWASVGVGRLGLRLGAPDFS